MEDKSLLFQYATCLHWAVAQLGVGQTELEAVGLFEKLFSIGVMFAALFSFSTLLSSMTSLLANISRMRSAEDHDLSHRITRFLQHRYAVQKNVQAVDATPDILELLSKSLKGELQVQRYKESPLRGLARPQAGDARGRRCDFRRGVTGNHILLLGQRGLCIFSRIFREESTVLHLGGRNETSRVISVDVDAVSDYLGQVNETRSITSAYARRCVDEINRVGAVSDLWEDYEAEEDEAQASTPRHGKNKNGLGLAKIIPWAEEFPSF
eukprot:g16658.t1